MTTVDREPTDAREEHHSGRVDTTTRFDPPHSPRADQPLDDVSVGKYYDDMSSLETHHGEFASLTENSLHVVQQLRLHANQLATHLQNQQKDLDERESRLNAQLADHESEIRTSRLHFDDTHS